MKIHNLILALISDESSGEKDGLAKKLQETKKGINRGKQEQEVIFSIISRNYQLGTCSSILLAKLFQIQILFVMIISF